MPIVCSGGYQLGVLQMWRLRFLGEVQLSPDYLLIFDRLGADDVRAIVQEGCFL